MTFRDRLDQVLAALAAEPHRYPHAELARAEEELRRYAEAESADAAAGSYAGRVEELEAVLANARELHPPIAGDGGPYCQTCTQDEQQPPPVGWWVPYPCPTAVALDAAAPAIAQPERWLHIAFTSPDETTANTSALALRDHLAAEFPGVGMRITTNAVDAEPVNVCTTACDEQHTYDWTCEQFAGIDNGEQPARTTPDNPVASSDVAEQLRAAIESEMYEYRERTMWWPEETGGVTKEIARLATRGALEALGQSGAGVHIYLSTGCWHGDHDYCKSMTGLNGAKRPASCKKCAAPCQCPCHTEHPEEQQP